MYSIYMKKHLLLCALAIVVAVNANAQVPQGALKGKFSVSADKAVRFSQGNLQCYLDYPRVWFFAEKQTDFIGQVAVNDTIDLFGWSGKGVFRDPIYGADFNGATQYYNGDFVDWGNNVINGVPAGTWHTLSSDEWYYLLCKRPNAATLFALATVDTVHGLIILPDDWTTPDGLTFTPSTEKGLQPSEQNYISKTEDGYSHNVYTTEQWQALEQAGAVFLPAAGMRASLTMYETNYCGYYWSSTKYVNIFEPGTDTEMAEAMLFSPSHVYSQSPLNIAEGRSVRLVCDYVEVVESAYEPQPITVSTHKQVLFSRGNLRYIQSAKQWAFADLQSDIIGAANMVDIVTLGDTIDLFGWSTDNTTAPFGISASIDKVNYRGNFVDWAVNAIGTDTANIWRTLTKDEWIYILFYRDRAAELAGMGGILLDGDTVHGLIILPDNWDFTGMPTFKPLATNGMITEAGVYRDRAFYNHYQDNIYTPTLWNRMEAAGAVFLPAAGDRYMGVNNVNVYGNYWASTPLRSYIDNAGGINFSGSAWGSNVSAAGGGARSNGHSVRLVKDISSEIPASTYQPHAVSIGENQYAAFAPANLQYTQSTKSFAFAPAQHYILGRDNVSLSSSEDVLADVVDLFGWSSDANNVFYGAWGTSTSVYNNNYKGEFRDWGTNVIGTDTADTWRTPTKDEWEYIFLRRPNAARLFGMGSVDTVSGVIILPDVWHTPAGITFTPNTQDTEYNLTLTEDGITYTQNGDYSPFDLNQYTLEQWHQMEAAGAVFLPAAGGRIGTEVNVLECTGLYHSATTVSADGDVPQAGLATYALEFMEGDEDPYCLAPQAQLELHVGMAVRLIRYCEPDPITSVNNPFAMVDNIQKVFRNGQVLILRGGKVYNMLGAEIK